MKKILVLTDFSKKATHAAEAAVLMASRLNANLILLHTFVTEAALPYAETGPWTAEVFTLQEQESEQGLKELTNHLKPLIERIPIGQHKPDIATLAVPEGLGSQLKDLAAEKNLEMIVMGARGNNAFEHLLFGSDTNTVINQSPVPVLIVPEDAALTDIRKIVYATDFDEKDMMAIHYLVNLGNQFKARVEVAHIELAGEDHEAELATQMSLIENLAKLKYKNIAYNSVRGKDAVQRLQRLCREEKPEVMAMLHHQRSIFTAIFKKSQTRKALAELSLPLLVFPSGMQP